MLSRSHELGTSWRSRGDELDIVYPPRPPHPLRDGYTFPAAELSCMTEEHIPSVWANSVEPHRHAAAQHRYANAGTPPHEAQWYSLSWSRLTGILLHIQALCEPSESDDASTQDPVVRLLQPNLSVNIARSHHTVGSDAMG